MFIHQFKLNQLRTRFASSRLLAVCLVVVSTLFLANSVPLSVSANSDGSEPATFASSAAQNRQGEMGRGVDIPPTGQISVIGDDIGLMLHNGNRANPGVSAQRAIRGSLSIADEGLIYVTHDNQPRVQARASNTNAPYIVANGVQMYEVSQSESGGWRTRFIGDDTYGSGELIAVAVEFSETVRVDGETTFRIRLDSGNRDLVPASYRDETVIFAALINPSDNDSNGVWIGDNTSTLDHNDADAIRSTGDSPRNANLTHARLGTQSNHKVKGSSTRPQLQSVRISSTPQYGDTYIRGEAYSKLKPDSTGPSLSMAMWTPESDRRPSGTRLRARQTTPAEAARPSWSSSIAFHFLTWTAMASPSRATPWPRTVILLWAPREADRSPEDQEGCCPICRVVGGARTRTTRWMPGWRPCRK